jgi:hypothetical protein
MSTTGNAPAGFYRAAEVAATLRCSEWWIKEQARHHRIPYSWIGGSYLFTTAHVAEIVRLFEVQPAESAESVLPVGRITCATPEPGSGPAVRLVARVPRRTRAAGVSEAA